MGVTIAARARRPVLLAAALAASLLALPARAGAATADAKGIDVSHWNGVIDWIRVAGGGYRFVFGKATEGFTLVDPTYAVNRAGTEGFGLKFGAYHFARPSGGNDAAAIASAVEQADHFVDVAAPKAGELPPVLDLEKSGGLPQARLRTWTEAWLDEVSARLGVQSLIYASPNFWTTALGDSSDFAAAGHPLWIAHWTHNAAPLVPAGDWAGRGWTFWQWTNCSRVPGFAHCSDGDRMNGPDPGQVAIASYPTGVPVAGTAPSIVGDAKRGRALAAVPGAWSGGKPVSFAYQWQSCDAAGTNCADLPGATDVKYTPSPADVGRSLAVVVTATSGQGSVSASSAPTGAVAGAGAKPAARPEALTPPAVSGTAEVGQTLTTDAGAWTGSPGTFAYQWQRCDESGATCADIAAATGSTYVPTPDDVGSTLSVTVTATGRGGAASVLTAPTPAVAAAPVPTAVPGSLTAQPGQAGAVVTPDGRATVTWQPGAVPDGLTMILVPFHGGGLPIDGTQVALGVADLPPGGFSWPVDIDYAAPQPAGTVLAYSTDSKLYVAVPKLAGPELTAQDTIGWYTGTDGLLHVLTRIPVRLALFHAGVWGDPSRSSATGPTLVQKSPVHLEARRDGTTMVLTRLTIPSQANLYGSVYAKGSVRLGIVKKGSRLGPWLGGSFSKTARTLVLKPGGLPVRILLRRRDLVAGHRYRLRVVAIDPWGRRAVLVLPFQAPGP